MANALGAPEMPSFRKWLRDFLGLTTPDENLANLRSAGLLVEERFRVRRAFEVREFEDEGRHLFLELEDGRVLFMSGQYLYDYGVDPSGPAEAGPWSFPATDFLVLRHRDEHWVCDIEPSGRTLAPQAEVRAFTPKDYSAERVPEDGEIITTQTFEELVASEGRLRGDQTHSQVRA